MGLMKILQINVFNSTLSTGRTTYELSNYLESKGHISWIGYSRGAAIENGYQIGNWFDRKVHAFMSRLIGKQGYFSKIATAKLVDFIKSFAPDVVHLRNLHSNYINIPQLLNFLATNDIPTVITLHDCWFYTGKCMYYTSAKCYKWKVQCGKCPQLKKDNRSWFFDFSAKMLNDKKLFFERIPRLAVVGVSDWITEESRQSILKSAKILKRIYNWIDLERFKPVNTEEEKHNLGVDNKFIILGVASDWSERKGLSYFFEIGKKIDNDSIIILIGRINKKISLPKNILNIPATHNIDELVCFYSMADVFLNCSLEETFGKVTAEALACGTPVITNDSTANPELVDENCGFIYQDFDDIPNHIEEVRQNGKKYFTKTCVEFARKTFDARKLMVEYEHLYEDLISYS